MGGRAVRVVAGVLLLLVASAVSQQADQDGRPPVWDRKIRSQLAPELKQAFDQTHPPTPTIEEVKSSLDRGVMPALGLGNEGDFAATAIMKGILDSVTPSFKLPPGVAFPAAPSVGHMVVQQGSLVGLPNTEKNHISGVQRDAINAAVGTLRNLGDNEASPPMDAWGTRQTEGHKRFPNYGGYLKGMMDKYAVAPGFGIGALPHQALQAVSGFNPGLPFAPGTLGSGVDVLGLRRAQMSRRVNDENFNPLYPAFAPTQFQGAGFNVPAAAVGQFGNNFFNTYPKALAYATSVSATPMSGVQPVFV